MVKNESEKSETEQRKKTFYFHDCFFLRAHFLPESSTILLYKRPSFILQL